jgi:small subunit ribosomal protein S2
VAATVEARPGIGVKDLIEAGLHFGHQTKRWNPKMKRYIFGKRNGIHIIDLAKSVAMLEQALQFVYEVAVSGRKVLFVGTKKQAQQVIKEAAERCGQPYVTQRWLGGTLTNSVTIRRSVKRMRELDELEKNGAVAKMHKKEASVLRHELEKLRRNLIGVADMSEKPGALFIVDIMCEAIAVQEAKKLDIPVVAIVDTNCDPDAIRYVIPGNDDAIRAIKLIAEAMADSVGKAAAEYAKIAADEAKKRESVQAQAGAVSATGGEEAAKRAEGDRPRRAGDRPARRAPRAEGGRPRAAAAHKPKADEGAAGEAGKPAEAPAAAAKPAAGEAVQGS